MSKLKMIAGAVLALTLLAGCGQAESGQGQQVPAQQRTVQVGRDGKFSLGLPLRENDVYLIKLTAVK